MSSGHIVPIPYPVRRGDQESEERYTLTTISMNHSARFSSKRISQERKLPAPSVGLHDDMPPEVQIPRGVAQGVPVEERSKRRVSVPFPEK